jgi:hypothetical protein
MKPLLKITSTIVILLFLTQKSFSFDKTKEYKDTYNLFFKTSKDDQYAKRYANCFITYFKNEKKYAVSQNRAVAMDHCIRKLNDFKTRNYKVYSLSKGCVKSNNFATLKDYRESLTELNMRYTKVSDQLLVVYSKNRASISIETKELCDVYQTALTTSGGKFNEDFLKATVDIELSANDCSVGKLTKESETCKWLCKWTTVHPRLKTICNK